MCLSTPKVTEVQPAPTPVEPSPIGETQAPEVKTAVEDTSAVEKKKKARKTGTSALQTTSGLNIPTTSGLNIS